MKKRLWGTVETALKLQGSLPMESHSSYHVVAGKMNSL
jgi:hypothetical protein